MAVRKILITVDTEGDYDFDAYTEALEAAAVDAEGRNRFSADVDIEIEEVINE